MWEGPTQIEPFQHIGAAAARVLPHVIRSYTVTNRGLLDLKVESMRLGSGGEGESR